MTILNHHNQKLAGADLFGPDYLPTTECVGTVLVGNTTLLINPDDLGRPTISVGGRSYRATKYGMHGLANIKKILETSDGTASASFCDGALASAKLVPKKDEGVMLRSWCSCGASICMHQVSLLYLAAGDFTWPNKPPAQALIGKGLALPVSEYIQRKNSVSRAVRVAHWGSQWLALVGDNWQQQDLASAYEMALHEKWGRAFSEYLPETLAKAKRKARQNPLTQHRSR